MKIMFSALILLFSTTIIASTITELQATSTIKKIFPNEPMKLVVSDSPYFFKFMSGNYSLYLTLDGQHISESLLSVPSELQPVSNSDHHPILLSKLKDEDVVYFKAKDEKNILFAFVDTSCPICQAFVLNMDEILNTGISIKFLALPSTYKSSLITSNMSRIWCNNKDKQLFRNSFKSIVKGKFCDAGYKKITKQKKFGLALGATGTPFFITPNRSFSGFYGNKDLINDFK